MVVAGSGQERSFDRLYERPLGASRSGPLYNAFSYPTKISPESIALFIATHTPPGATVADTFGGSGTTGIATLLCDRPTQRMRQMAKDMGVAPEWGAREAHIFEIGTLGAFVARVLCEPPDPGEFARAAAVLCQQANERIGSIYAARDPQGREGVLRHAIWSDVLACANCAHETTYWEAALRQSPLRMADEFKCAHCRQTVRIDACKRATEVMDDAFGVPVETKRRVLVRVYGVTGGNKWQRPPNAEDGQVVQRAQVLDLPPSAPNAQIRWGELHRSGYHHGISRLHHFYTQRNFLAVSTLWELAGQAPQGLRDALRLLVLSYNASHATLMTRVVVKKKSTDLVLTGAQSGVLYVSGLPVEKNVIAGCVRKAKALEAAFAALRGSRSRVVVHNRSSEAMDLPDASVDYIFTDPPFGGYIPYAEINQINELWLGRTTERAHEIIISESQGKDVSAYGAMMGRVFAQMARVLRPDGMATVVFHSAHANIWRALVAAYADAGFSVVRTSVLDKIQASFKQVVSKVSVKGDPLLLLSREGAAMGAEDASSLHVAEAVIAASEHLADDERRPQRLYSRFVARCLEMGVAVDMGARDFYTLVEKRTGSVA